MRPYAAKKKSREFSGNFCKKLKLSTTKKSRAKIRRNANRSISSTTIMCSALKCICVCICLQAFIHTHMHVCMHLYSSRMLIDSFDCVCVCVCICTCVFVCTYAFFYIKNRFFALSFAFCFPKSLTKTRLERTVFSAKKQ